MLEIEINCITKKAIDTFGEEHQKMIAIEECSELINALAKEKRGRVTANDVIEEIADVMIVCRELAHIYGISNVENAVHDKLDRLSDRISRGVDH